MQTPNNLAGRLTEVVMISLRSANHVPAGTTNWNRVYSQVYNDLEEALAEKPDKTYTIKHEPPVKGSLQDILGRKR